MKIIKRLFPIIILLIALISSYILIKLKPIPSKIENPLVVTPVNFIVAEAKETEIIVDSQGIIKPKTESIILAEVSGKVINISDDFKPGKFVEKDSVLFQIDPSNYKDLLKISEHEFALAELNLIEQEALAAQAKSDWENFGNGAPSSLTIREPQLKAALARFESAKAALDIAKRDLEKTTIRAPFSGYILNKDIDLGSYISPSPLSSNGHGRIYASGDGEIRLSINSKEKSFIESGINSKETIVIEFYDSNSYEHITTGYLDRIEATIDSKNQLNYCVGLITDAFPIPNLNFFGLQRNQYLLAKIKCKNLPSAFTIPESALRNNDTIYVINKNNKLEQKKITIINYRNEEIIVKDGLNNGDRIVTGPVSYYVEGMQVQPILNK